MINKALKSTQKDYLWDQLKELPYFRAFLRAVEARFYQDIKLPRPILDLGCGDGHFVTAAFDQKVDIGIDPWTGPVREAARRGGYRLVVHGTGNEMPFPNAYFSSCISNSVLEHIPDIDAVLLESARVIKPGGTLVFCVPSHNFLANLSISTFFDHLGLHGIGNLYRKFFNYISRHHHCDNPQTWQARLGKAGFTVERYWHYFSPAALHVLEWGHYFGLPSLFSHWVWGKWILVPKKWNLFLTQSIVQKYYNEAPEQSQGSYTFYIARRNAV